MAAPQKIKENNFFRREFLCFPLSECKEVIANKNKLEFSDKVVLPRTALEHLARFHDPKDDSPMVFRLNRTNSKEAIYCSIGGFSEEERNMYVPNWMIELLNVGGERRRVSITNVTIPKGEYITLRPHDDQFFKLQNPKNVLEMNLRQYCTLYKGQTIRVPYLNKVWSLDVVGAMPSDVIDIANANLILDLVGKEGACDQNKKGEPMKVVPINKEGNAGNAGDDPNYWSNLGSGNKMGPRKN